jgi:hypothetical protein
MCYLEQPSTGDVSNGNIAGDGEECSKGVTPLYIAADRGTPQTVAALLTAGAAIVWDHK